MLNFSGWSLKTKVIAVVILCIFIQGSTSFYNMKQVETGFTDRAQSSLSAQAEGLSANIASQIYERYGDVQAFALNDAVRSMESKRMQHYLDQYVTLYGLYDLILVVDKNGQFVSSNSKDVAGKSVQLEGLKKQNFKDEVWFKNVLAGTTTDDKERAYSGTFVEDFIQDPLMKSAFDEVRYGTSFSAAIRDDKGEIIGVVTNRAGKRWFEAEVKDIITSMKDSGYHDAEITVVNGDNKVISYLKQKENGEIETIEDPKIILNLDFIKEVADAGESYLKSEKGVGIFKMDDGATDVVAYRKLNDDKWPAPIKWGVFVHDDSEDSLKDVKASMRNFYFFFFSALFIGIVMAMMFSISISKSLSHVSNTLTKNSGDLKNASGSVSKVALELSESATEQAAAIQETMAAVDEISAMVEKNAESAQRSQEVSQQSRQVAERGQQVMGQMMTAIEEIDNSNEEIARQMQESNARLAEITSLIDEIGNKTKVINDIVFQTKLLSFNASVEAARAGEYGKGFSVVAEEVGNLAQMSGAAAKEITSLLNESVQKVNHIVSESKGRVEKMIVVSKDKVKVGSERAEQCTAALNEILENVQNVDSLVSEIVVASNEQSTGIREVSKAVSQMEQVTQKVSSMAQGSSASSDELNSQATELNQIIDELADVIQGHHGTGPTVSAHHSSGGTESSGRGNVVQMTNFKSREFRSEKTHASQAATTFAVPLSEETSTGPYVSAKKIASNSDFIPSNDDPGFE